MTKFKQGDKVIVTDCVVEDTFDNMVKVRMPNNGCKTLMKEFVEHQQPKPKVPQVAVDYYDKYKNTITDFCWWFSNLSKPTFVEKFPKAEELERWLYRNNKKTNQQRELAFATLIVNGPDAVEIEEEKEYAVELKTTNQILVYNYKGENYYFKLKTAPRYINDEKSTFTDNELIDAGFGGVFDNKMFEIKEVK